MPYFWKNLFLDPLVYVPVIVVMVASMLWWRGLRLNKYKNITVRGITCTIASLICGLIMVAFYAIKNFTEPAIEGAGIRYMMHERHWATAGMVLSVIGVVIAIFGRGAARILIILLMMASFAGWFFLRELSYLTW